MAKQKAIRDRIKDFRRVKAEKLKPSPANWRKHPDAQRTAMREVLEKIGYADALIVRETGNGKLEILDGHLRAETTPKQEVPCLVVDLDDDEARTLLLTHDPLGAMALADDEKLKELMEASDKIGDELLAALDGQHAFDDIERDSEIQSLPTKPPPKMSWVLVGIPTVRFGEIAAVIESLADLPETIVETTVNDG